MSVLSYTSIFGKLNVDYTYTDIRFQFTIKQYKKFDD